MKISHSKLIKLYKGLGYEECDHFPAIKKTIMVRKKEDTTLEYITLIGGSKHDGLVL